jgi:hypothetical protein
LVEHFEFEPDAHAAGERHAASRAAGTTDRNSPRVARYTSSETLTISPGVTAALDEEPYRGRAARLRVAR